MTSPAILYRPYEIKLQERRLEEKTEQRRLERLKLKVREMQEARILARAS